MPGGVTYSRDKPDNTEPGRLCQIFVVETAEECDKCDQVAQLWAEVSVYDEEDEYEGLWRIPLCLEHLSQFMIFLLNGVEKGQTRYKTYEETI